MPHCGANLCSYYVSEEGKCACRCPLCVLTMQAADKAYAEERAYFAKKIARQEAEKQWLQWDGWPRAGDVLEFEGGDDWRQVVLSRPDSYLVLDWSAGPQHCINFPPSWCAERLARVWRAGTLVWENKT